MKSLPASLRRVRSGGPLGHSLRTLPILALLACAAAASLPARAATLLADQPLFATPVVPGNLALALSVEFPTAISVAHTNRAYSAASEYLGYFDPAKCYDYSYTDGTSAENFFVPAAKATGHVCSAKWSGNFLNWASMQTIDPFRWVLTGGYRVIDETTRTVIEKAWSTNQGSAGSNFPDSTLASAEIAGATPFPASTPSMSMRVWNLGNKMRFAVPGGGATFRARYYGNTTLSGAPVYSNDAEPSINYNISGAWPSSAIPTTNMSANWVGTVTAPTAGTYKFRIRGDDGVRLSVNGSVLPGGVDSGWRDQGPTDYDSADFTVAAGHVFNIAVDFYQKEGGAEVSLQWRRPGDSSFSIVGASSADLYSTATPYNGTSKATGTVFEAFVRAKVCDASLGASYLESNCQAYGSNYKPQGLLQQYSDNIRYSAFGYLNDSNILRDGGVLRAQQKFVGPTKPVPGSPAVVNSAREWDASTGVYGINPDKPDADSTALIFGTINNSGVLNYLNKFGEITPGEYKTYDNVSELYYAAIRYFKALPDVPEWTTVTGATTAQKTTWADGFPVITSPADPILYSCQSNFILGIGDTNSHADKNVPGNTQTANEPALPAAVSADPTNAVTATNKVGELEGLGLSAGTTNPWGPCCSNNSALMAGLAFDAHINDIRPDDATKLNTIGKQTITTYWVDVQEGLKYADNNQFYLATKYGGFRVPVDYEKSPVPLDEAWWHANVDTFGANKRPDNYFSGGRPDLMKAGLDAAFKDIAGKIASAFTTSFATALPQVTNSGNSSFSSQYDARTWTGQLSASSLAFDPTTSATTLVEKWKFTDKLALQLAGTGWSTSRRMLSWNGSNGVAFRASGGGFATTILDSDLAKLDTSFRTGDDSAKYLDYLRGDRTNEVDSTATGSTKAYRTRSKLLGDIVGSRARAVGGPSLPLSDATNPGYLSFKTTWATRRTVVYVGANDGMMHAINGALDAATATPALETDADAGKEMFAYVPRVLFQGPTAPNTDGLASLGNPSFTHHYMVNATPQVRDVDFARVSNAAKVRLTPAIGTYDWHSVLIGGLGKGGKAYYAIDVTDPVGMATSGDENAAAAKVLWEFTDPSLGFTYGDPIVVKTQKYGWVAVLTSGYNNADGIGYFFFVNPKTGALLEKVPTGAGSVAADAGLANANAFIVDATDGTADAVYAGDLLGNLWRLDITGTTNFATASRMKNIATLADGSGNAQPVTSRPTIAIHPATKKRFVMVGTGRLLDKSDTASTREQSFYAIVDGTNAAFNATPIPPAATPSYPMTRSSMVNSASPLTGVIFDPATKVGWYEDLGVDASTAAGGGKPAHTGTGIAWRVTSDSTTLAGAIAFAANLPNGDVCSPSGDSRVYGRDYASALSTVKVDSSATAALLSFVQIAGNVTDLRYLSVNGKPVLLSGTDTGKLKSIDITPLGSLSLRRLNWRELQVVD